LGQLKSVELRTGKTSHLPVPF